MERAARRGAIAAAGVMAAGGWIAGSVLWKVPAIEKQAVREVREALVNVGIDVNRLTFRSDYRKVRVEGIQPEDLTAAANAPYGGLVAEVQLGAPKTGPKGDGAG